MEGVFGVDAENYEYSLTVAVIVLGDGFVFVLAGSVPDLELDPHSVDCDDFIDVVDADGHHVVIHKFALTVPEEDVALTDS